MRRPSLNRQRPSDADDPRKSEPDPTPTTPVTAPDSPDDTQARPNRTLHSATQPRRRRTPRNRPSRDALKEINREVCRLMGLTRTRPSREILSGDSADVYFARAARVLEREGLDPVVTMEVFGRQEALLCGIDEAKNLLGHVLADCDRPRPGSRRSTTATPSARRRSSSGSAPATASSACTRPRSSGCSPSPPAGRPPPGNASTRPPRCR